MKITNKNYNLKPGTYLEDTVGIIAIVSEYDTNYKRYEYHDVEINDDGDLVELSTGGYVTPVDLIGYEIVYEPKPEPVVKKSFVYTYCHKYEIQALESAGVELCDFDEAEVQFFATEGIDFGDDDYRLIKYEKAYDKQVNEIINYFITTSFTEDIVSEEEIQVLKDAGVKFYFVNNDIDSDYVGDDEYLIKYEKAYATQVSQILWNTSVHAKLIY